MNKPSHISAFYRITASSDNEANQIAQNLCVEQSVEMPPETVSEHVKSFIAELVSINQQDKKHWSCAIQFPISLFENDTTQFLNVLFGNSSLQPGIQVIGIDLSVLKNLLPGPSFGISGIRKLLGIKKRAMSSTALKPIGLSADELAQQAFLFAKGGIDIIKDDHGLADQSTAPFSDRISACIRAIKQAEELTGKRTLYFPNITASAHRTLQRFEEALQAGADGILISPQLCGLETMREIANMQKLPIMAHPAFSGSYVINPNQGFDPAFYYGTLWRALGADCIVYPNAKGRFSFELDDCKRINENCRQSPNIMKPSLPTPGGGINRESVDYWLGEYGPDTLFLIGGSLYQHPDGIESAASEFQQMLLTHGK